MVTIITNRTIPSSTHSNICFFHTFDMEKYKDFALRLRSLIDEKKEQIGVKKLSQVDLGKAWGVEQSFVSQLVTGKKLPSSETAITICDYFGCCMDWLLRGVGPKKPGHNMDIYDLIDETTLTTEQKATFKALLRSFIEQKNNGTAH